MILQKDCFPKWQAIHTLIFDFDGVFTDNKVWVDQKGNESVRCDRGDGLAFDMLRKFIAVNHWDLRYFILSRETNPVVSIRAEKLKIDCVRSIRHKGEFVSSYLNNKCLKPTGLLYVGNDLNDLQVMSIAGWFVAPADSHPKILESADVIFPQTGGNGFVRAFIEELININKMKPKEILNLL